MRLVGRHKKSINGWRYIGLRKIDRASSRDQWPARYARIVPDKDGAAKVDQIYMFLRYSNGSEIELRLSEITLRVGDYIAVIITSVTSLHT